MIIIYPVIVAMLLYKAYINNTVYHCKLFFMSDDLCLYRFIINVSPE